MHLASAVVRTAVNALVIAALGGALGLPAAAAAAPHVTLTALVRTNVKENDWEKEVFAMYEKAHPNVTIKEILFTTDADKLSKLTTLFAAGDPPDIWDHGGKVATDHYNGWLLNLRPLIDRDMADLDRTDIFPGAWNSYIGPKFAAGLPFISTPSPMWVNVDLFDKGGVAIPPIDWSDSSWTFGVFSADARKLTRVDATGRVVQWGAGLVGNGELERYTWPKLGGGTFWDQPQTWQSGVPQTSHFDSPANVAVYSKYVGLVREGVATNDLSGWYGGTMAMVGGAGGWEGFGNYQNMKFRWSMAPMPYSPDTGDVIYTDAWVISSQTKHVPEAWDLVKFLTSKAAMIPYMKIAVFPPVRPSVLQPFIEETAQASGYLTAAQVLLSIEGGINNGVESPDHRLAGEPDYNTAISPIFAKIWSGQLSPKEGLAQADQVVQPIMKKYEEGIENGHEGTTR